MSEELILKIGFIVLVFLCLSVFMSLLKASSHEGATKGLRKKVSFFLAGTVAILLTLARIGFFENWSLPPRIFVILIFWITTLIVVFRNRNLQAIFMAIPKEKVVFLQTFRIAVEIILWRLFIIEVIPVQMTFEGYNFDVLVGLTAPLIGYLIAGRKISPKGVVLWNVFGLILITTIITIGIVSTPTILRVFMNDPANTFVASVPYVLLPGFLVPLGYFLHILSIYQHKS
ncbi:MAG: hypothetical protein MRY83_07810 [Flavobacteriales bacterium]|nr:hypothetical protein [Flavobacteriales bacterium]